MQSRTRLAIRATRASTAAGTRPLISAWNSGEPGEDLGVVVDGRLPCRCRFPAQQPRDGVAERVRRYRHRADRQRRQSDRGRGEHSTGSGDGPDGQRSQHPTRAHDR